MTLDIHCNMVVSSTIMVGMLCGYREVWGHLTGTANILSLSMLCEQYLVTFDSDVENKFMVVKQSQEQACTLVNMVADNHSEYLMTMS